MQQPRVAALEPVCYECHLFILCICAETAFLQPGVVAQLLILQPAMAELTPVGVVQTTSHDTTCSADNPVCARRDGVFAAGSSHAAAAARTGDAAAGGAADASDAAGAAAVGAAGRWADGATACHGMPAPRSFPATDIHRRTAHGERATFRGSCLCCFAACGAPTLSKTFRHTAYCGYAAVS